MPSFKYLIVSAFMLIACIHSIQADSYIVVDRAGTGHFRNIQQAIDSVANQCNQGGLTTIFIKNGFYKEKFEIPSTIHHLHIKGEDKNSTIINYDDHAQIDKMGTFKTYTLKVSATHVLIENLTIENSAQPLGQAVALHIDGNKVMLKNCRLLGNQDTLYAGDAYAYLYFEDCYIEGTTDFIFGPATAWFENCHLFCKKKSYITAANTPEDVAYGFIFNRCTVEMAPDVHSVYLGRPWRPFAMTLFMHSYLPAGIHAAGWDNWRNPQNETTARYYEYHNRGEGADISQRVLWMRTLSTEEIIHITPENILLDYNAWVQQP